MLFKWALQCGHAVRLLISRSSWIPYYHVGVIYYYMYGLLSVPSVVCRPTSCRLLSSRSLQVLYFWVLSLFGSELSGIVFVVLVLIVFKSCSWS